MNALLYDPDRLAAALDEAGLDALIVTTAPNVRYLTRFGKPGSSLAIVGRDNPSQPRLLVSAGEIDYLVEDLVPETPVHVWGDFVRVDESAEPLDVHQQLVACAHRRRRPDLDRPAMLGAVMSELGLARARVGLDVAPESEPRLAGTLTNCFLGNASRLLSGLRMRKTELEVTRIQEAARIAEAGISATAAAARAGSSQAELATEYRMAVAREGGLLRVDSVSVGVSTVFGNANVTDAILRQGDLLRFDVGAIYYGYQSDLSRCFSLGAATAKAERYANAVIAGQSAALDMLRPGVRTADLFAAAVAATRRAGIPHYDRTHVGHGIGLAGGYDAPLLAPHDPHTIEEGMVLCVETPYYEFGFGGVQIEDMVVVTENGWRPLTQLPRTFETL
ncbi:MAG: Xaa-Pro peptidase family protein [Actinomycetota bacterium]|nr:Xaa-Pro peptidase family protein [Actinomycetota bacterium]